MNKSAEEIVGLLKNDERKNHLVLLCGNIYDTILFGNHSFSDTADFLLRSTEIKFKNALRYDIFSGLKVIRGEEDEIAEKMGVGSKSQSQDPLVQALRQNGIARESKFPQNPEEIFLCIDRFFSCDEVKPTIFLVEYVNKIVPANFSGTAQVSCRLGVAITKWARSSEMRKKGHLIFLLCRNSSSLDEEILQRCHEILQIRLPKPDSDARTKFFIGNTANIENAQILSSASSGLAIKELQNLKDKNIEEVFILKKKILGDEYGDVLEIMEAKHGFASIGGLEKNINEIKKIVRYMREGKTELVPQGIRFDGPPGTGKTILAEAMAKEAGLNFVKERDIKHELVGRSERRQTEFLSALRDLSPVVWFIDEIDQAQTSRNSFDGDSGTSRSLFKKKLEFMSDPALRGKVLVVMATNRPDLLDSAMKRPGRCDLVLPFLPFDGRDLASICGAAFKQFPQMKSGIKDWMPYAKHCKEYSGAMMIEVVRRAWKRAYECDREEITDEDMIWAIADYKPPTYDRQEVIRMSLLAIIECSSKSLLPDDWEERAEKWFYELTGETPKTKNDILKKEAFLGPWTSKELN